MNFRGARKRRRTWGSRFRSSSVFRSDFLAGGFESARAAHRTCYFFIGFPGNSYEKIIFYYISKLYLESIYWLEIFYNLKINYDLICILILFFLIYLFNYVKSNIDYKKGIKNIDKFIDSKKIISIVLIPVMIVLFAVGIFNWYSLGLESNFANSFYYVNEVFYNTFFSILIIADVFILLLSFLYTERYSQIMRNTGFIICTILIRLSFSSSGLTNLLLIISSVLFGLLILKIYSLMNKIE